jgi:FKBP-type peptidyl-prolyl cis-trans isomerase
MAKQVPPPTQDRSLLTIGIITAVAALAVLVLVVTSLSDAPTAAERASAGAAQNAAPSVTACTLEASGQLPTPVALEANAGSEGVTTTASGLQYQVLNAADGATPTAANTVTVHYIGRLVDGTVFDSSCQRGQPASFGLTQVIPGWTEGLQQMPVGSTYRFTIPGDLAYGPEGRPGTIPPNATLIFDVTLLAISG